MKLFLKFNNLIKERNYVQEQLAQAESMLDSIDSKIDQFEKLNLPESADRLSQEYNRWNLIRIDLEIKYYKLELKLSKLEKKMISKE